MISGYISLHAPPQGPRKSGARKPQSGVGCDQPLVGCQCRPLLRLTLVMIQAALFVSFLARTGRQKIQRALGLGIHLKALFRMSMHCNPC